MQLSKRNTFLPILDFYSNVSQKGKENIWLEGFVKMMLTSLLFNKQKGWNQEPLYLISFSWWKGTELICIFGK